MTVNNKAETPDTCTLAEGILSILIGTGKLDETNPQLLRTYEEKAAAKFGISKFGFYTAIYVYSEDPNFDDSEYANEYAGSYNNLDELVDQIVNH